MSEPWGGYTFVSSSSKKSSFKNKNNQKTEVTMKALKLSLEMTLWLLYPAIVLAITLYSIIM